MVAPARTFISYAREDAEFALTVAKELRAAGAKVWLDQLDISPGQRWDRAVEDALHSCPSLLVVLSPASVDSANVMDEVSFALEEQKAVIPVVYQDCKIPFRLRRLQHVDFRRDYRGGISQLFETFGLETEQAKVAYGAPAAAPRQASDDSIVPPTSETPGQRARIELEKARRQYRQRVDEALSDRQISIGEHDTLDELRRRLGLSQEDADEIEVEAHRPITAYVETIEEYKKTLRKHIAQRYPLLDDQRKDLELRKRDLGLKDEDAAATEALVLAEAENDHKAQRAAMAAEAQEIDRRNKARQRAADALLSATAAVEKKQFAIARKHVAAARDADPEHPDVTGWDSKISDAAAGARREAESELRSAKDAIRENQRDIYQKHLAAARAADPEYDIVGWTKTFSTAAEAFPTAPRLAANKAPDETVRKKPVLAALMAFKGQDSFFVAPEIPAKKSQNARSRCQIPPGEELLAIIDLTMFGSAKNCWAFTDVALYYYYEGRRAVLEYEDFPQCMFRPWGDYWLEAKAADGRSAVIMPGDRKQCIAILDTIKTAVSG